VIIEFFIDYFKTPVIFTLFDKVKNIAAGTCILLLPKTPHEFYPDNCELVHDWIHFMPSACEEFMNLKIFTNTFFTVDDTNFITASLKKCEVELIYKDEFYKELISSEVNSMFIRLKRQCGKSISGHHSDSFKMLRVDMYRNPQNYTSTEDMARFVNLSRSRFSNIYTEFFGISPQKDHINARISKAKHLLSIDTLSLTEISEACGYHNIYHFIRQFRAITGITPGKYRNNC